MTETGLFMDLLWRALCWGVLGLQVECFFTGFRSLLKRDFAGTCTTYLVMLPVYAVAGTTFDLLGSWFDVVVPMWPYLLRLLVKASVYLPLIYAFEFVYGTLLLWIIRRVPWQYEKVRWTDSKGRVRLDYAPYWFGLALLVDPASNVLQHVLNIMVRGF